MQLPVFQIASLTFRTSWLLAAMVLALVVVTAVDFSSRLEVVSVSETRNLSPDGTNITIHYNAPVQLVQFDSADNIDLYAEISPDGKTETHTIRHAPYNGSFTLTRQFERKGILFNFGGLPEAIAFSTGKEPISIERMIPAEHGSPTPESMDNQLVLQFRGNVIGSFQQGENIPVDKMDVVKLSPVVPGYYRWNSPSQLTFNFTEQPPQYNTTYQFDIYTEKLIKPETQAWVDARRSIGVSTASNEVYVRDISLNGRVNWQSPLRITFSGNMVGALDVLKAKSPEVVPITITPERAGVWTWLNAYTIKFVPEATEGWPTRQMVTIAIQPEINLDTERAWRGGDEPHVHSFEVLPRRQSIRDYNLRGDHTALDDDLVVRFSRDLYPEEQMPEPMRLGSTAAIQPLLISPAIEGEFVWISPGILRFHPDNLWSELKAYTVKLNPEYNPDSRFEWVGIDNFTFKTVENLLRYELYEIPENALAMAKFYSHPGRYLLSGKVAPESRLWILFDQSISDYLEKDADVAALVQFTPQVKGEYKWLTHQLLEFVPENNWRELSDYQIHFNKALLHHPEQHFLPGKELAKFSSKENLVRLTLDGRSLPKGSYPQAVENALTFNFSKNMKQVMQVGKRYSMAELGKKAPVQLSPPLQANIEWQDSRTLRITPQSYWSPETNYTLLVNPKILPQAESAFDFNPRIQLATKKNIVGLSSFTPTGKVAKRIVIDAAFSKNIKPKGIALGAVDPYGLFTIEPSLQGKWLWMADNKLQFRPVDALPSSTKFTVTLDPNRVPDKQFSWQLNRDRYSGLYASITRDFFTPALHVEQINAHFEFNEKDLLKQRFYLDVTLSDAVAMDELRKRFNIWFNKTVEGKNVEVPLIYSLKKSDDSARGDVRAFTVVSDWIERPATNRTIYYKINGGLAPVAGNRIMLNDYASDFLQEKPKHIQLNGSDWSWQGKYYSAIVTLSAPVEPDKLSRFLTVKQSDRDLNVGDITIHENNQRNSFSYLINGQFEPEKTYTFSIGAGLLAADGAFTPEVVHNKSRTPALARKLAFALGGSFISEHDLEKVPVVSVNYKSLNIQLERVYGNNLNSYINHKMNHNDISDIAKVVYRKVHYIKELTGQDKQRNQEVITHIDMSKMFNKNPFGLYRIVLMNESNQQVDSRWFLSTDIGLVARRFNNRVVIWANSLHNNSALDNVQISLVDRWNQEVGQVTTNAQGVASIALPQNNQLTHLVAMRGGDLSFLDFRTHRESLTKYNIEGISSNQSVLRSYIYSDRGVYRPGDRAHLVSVTRQKEGRLPTHYPLTFRLTSPSGKHVLAEGYKLDDSGIYIRDFAVPVEAKTGKWVVTSLWQGNSIGSYTFQVEEFIPNKIKVKTILQSPNIHAGDILKFKVKANNLFGPPAANQRVNASVNLRAAYFRPKGYERFSFGHEDRKFQRMDTELPESKLDAHGEYTFEYAIPEGIDSPIGLSAHYAATVIDDGGRGVSSYGKTDVYLFPQYIGVRQLNRDSGSVGQAKGFEVVNVAADGQAIARNQQQLAMKVYLNKEVTHYRKNERGHFRYVREQTRVLLEELGDPRDSQGKLIYTPEYAGDHVLEIRDLVGGQVTRQPFHVAGAQSSSQKVIAGDKVELRVLTADVKAGGYVKLAIRSPFAGKVLLIGEREKVLFKRVLQVGREAQTVELAVPAAWLPNFYVSATAIRAVPEGDRDHPIYASGLVNVELRDPAHSPKIHLEAPKQANPNSALKLKLTVDDRNNADMYFTIAAVDVGILELTKFKLPAMNGYFQHKRKLEVSHYSIYPMVMPYEPEVKFQITPSGDAPSRALIKKKRVNPNAKKRVKPVALWSGLLKFDEQGVANVTLNIPDFDGTLRVMAVAFGQQRFASTEQEVVVRDNLVVKPTLPRFAAAGDDFAIPIKLFNGTSLDGDIQLKIETSDHLKILGSTVRKLTLAAGGEQMLSFAAEVSPRLGLATVNIVAEGLGEVTRKAIHLPVRSPGTLITLAESGEVNERTPKSIVIPDQFIEGSQALAMKVSSRRLDQFGNSMSWLLRYPHGCLEQTTSKVFPLLYYGDMVQESKQDKGARNARYYLHEGIAKIERMQLSNGGIAYWEGGSDINPWAFVYAAHFLVEAKKAGWSINQEVWNNMLIYLNKSVASPPSQRGAISHYLYGLYVLAQAGENVLSRINQVYDHRFDGLAAHDKARLAVAFFASGVPKTANKILHGLGDLSDYSKIYRYTGGNFGSNIRDLAIILDAWGTIDPESKQVMMMAEMLAAKAAEGRWGTTQENAYALLALGKAYRSQTDVTVKLTFGDGSSKAVKGSTLLHTPELLAGEVRLEVEGPGRAVFAWEAIGINKAPTTLLEDHGIKVRRRYLDREGELQSLDDIRQGDLVVVELKMEALQDAVANVVITDLLPMGLEIENFRLSTSTSLPWIRSDISPDHVDMRDDRMNLFLTIPKGEKHYYYTTRAVTVGSFAVPAVRAEAMYDPEIFSESGSGKLKVLPKP